MSWSCKHLTLAEVQAHDENGDLKRLLDDSKDSIENSKNYLQYNSDANEDAKYNHWLAMFLSHAGNTVIPDKDTQTVYLIGAYFNNILYMLCASNYDSSDNTYNMTNSLVGKKSNSKAYAFSKEFWTPCFTLMKSIGSTAMVFYTVKGGSMTFRSATAKAMDGLVDYNNMTQTEEIEKHDIDSINNAIPTIDGSTKESVETKLADYESEIIKTVRPLL